MKTNKKEVKKVKQEIVKAVEKKKEAAKKIEKRMEVSEAKKVEKTMPEDKNVLGENSLKKAADELNQILFSGEKKLFVGKKRGLEGLKRDIVEASKELTDDDEVSPETQEVIDLLVKDKTKKHEAYWDKEHQKVADEKATKKALKYEKIEKKEGKKEGKTTFFNFLIEQKKYTCSEIIEKVQAKFPNSSKASTYSLISHGKNPKYAQKIIKVSKEGFLHF